MFTRSKAKSMSADSSAITPEVSSSIEILFDKLKSELLDVITKSISKAVSETESNLKEIINNQNKIIAEQNAHIKNLEFKLLDLETYNRRNNLEISGIPTTYDNDSLEDIVLEICHKIDKSVISKDIEACHWLGTKKKSRVIVRFVNRKICKNLLANKKSLKDAKFSFFGDSEEDLKKRIYFSENLIGVNRMIWFQCRNLHKEKKFHSYWSSNGTVRIRLHESDKTSIQIISMGHLNELFPVDSNW